MHKRHPNSLTKADSYTSQNDDLVRRNFTAPAPGTKYISDMTEIKCADGKLYLAAILDCFDGAVVGYAMHPHMRASLCCDAFRNAVSRYGYQTGLILHSDHGSQYTSQDTVRCSLSMNPFVRVWDAHIAVLTMRGWKVFCNPQKGVDLSALLHLYQKNYQNLPI